MGTALGGTSASAVVFTVISAETSTIIERGQMVTLAPIANPDEIGVEQIYTRVIRAASATGKYIGVANHRIGPGEQGTITHIGPCLVQTDGTVVTDVGIEPAASVYLAKTHDGTGDAQGVALEDDHVALEGQDFGTPTNTYAYCFVNFSTRGNYVRSAT